MFSIFVRPDYGYLLLGPSGRGKKTRKMVGICVSAIRIPEALAVGLCNVITPYDQIDTEVNFWCAEILDKTQ